MILARRAWLRSLVGQSVQPPDTTRRSEGAADPLQRPHWVDGTRRIVDEYQNHPVVVGVERRLRCTCPCGLDIFTCRTTDFTCTYSPALHDEVVALVRGGKSADDVVAAFVAKYGEQILLAPKARGLGVLGYGLPGAIILLVGGALGWVLVRRSRRMAPVPLEVAPLPPAPALSGADRARVEQALEDLEA